MVPGPGMSDQPPRASRPGADTGAGTCAPVGADTGRDEPPALRAGRVPPWEHLVNLLYGIRAPIVLILLIIAFMATISGKPLDGLLTLIAGVSLGWDTGRRARARGKAGRTREDMAHGAREPQAREAGAGEAQAGEPQAGVAQAGVAGAGEAQARESQVPEGGMPGGGAGSAAVLAGRLPGIARPRRPLVVLAGMACGAVYALAVGSFSRFSWPATVPVVALGTAVVVIGWRGPRRFRPVSGPLPVVGTALWGGVFVAGCLWELSSLLQQPNLETGSYAHPTISTLTDPVLATTAGRAVFLAAWLLLGWFLVER